MGSGKTFWARQLSRLLNIPAFDLDKEIENREEKTVAEVFEQRGEDHFRKTESEVLRSFEGRENFILATGGGTPCFHDNMAWMNTNGITIWIDEHIDVIVARLQVEKSHRPLIAAVENENLENFFTKMRDTRKLFYSKAEYHLPGNNINEENFLKILKHE